MKRTLKFILGLVLIIIPLGALAVTAGLTIKEFFICIGILVAIGAVTVILVAGCMLVNGDL